MKHFNNRGSLFEIHDGNIFVLVIECEQINYMTMKNFMKY
jgi:hypothetical protein